MKNLTKLEKRGGGNLLRCSVARGVMLPIISKSFQWWSSARLGMFQLSPLKCNVILNSIQSLSVLKNEQTLVRFLDCFGQALRITNKVKELINLSTYKPIYFQKAGFTLTEVLLSVAIVGIIAALILPTTMTKFNEKTLDLGFEREVKTISSAIDMLPVWENKRDFFSTMMYLDTEPESYEDNSGKFLKEYLRVTKYCGDNNGDCFAPKYYEYKNNKKEEYTPEYKGACAGLKNGMSICLQPQVGGKVITGILDINGPKEPNVYGRDLRNFEIPRRSRTGKINTTSEVLTAGDLVEIPSPETPLVPPEENNPEDPCSVDYNSPACCTKRGPKNPSDPCCNYADIYSAAYEFNCKGSSSDGTGTEIELDYRCYGLGIKPAPLAASGYYDYHMRCDYSVSPTSYKNQMVIYIDNFKCGGIGTGSDSGCEYLAGHCNDFKDNCSELLYKGLDVKLLVKFGSTQILSKTFHESTEYNFVKFNLKDGYITNIREGLK